MHRRKKDSFIELKDRIIAKIVGWKAKLLSQAARTTLVKSVVNAIPTYLMSLFLFPKSLCVSINSSIRKFLWGYLQDKKHCLSLLSWENICKPKSLGGLGIRTMEVINNSLLARIGWKMTSNQPHLWVDSLRGKYLKHGVSFLDAPSNALSSWLWKWLLKNRKVVEQGACISISSGRNVDVWNSPWIPLMPSLSLFQMLTWRGSLLIRLLILFALLGGLGILCCCRICLIQLRYKIFLPSTCRFVLLLISGFGLLLLQGIF